MVDLYRGTGSCLLKLLIFFAIVHSEWCDWNYTGATSSITTVKIIDTNIKKFGYNEYPLIRTNFLCIFLRVTSWAQCTGNLSVSDISFAVAFLQCE